MGILVRFLLSLCFLLLNAQGYVNADLHKKGALSQSIHLTEGVLQSLKDCQVLTIQLISPGTQGDRGAVDDVPDSEDEKDDEPTSFKKYTGNGNYFYSLIEGRSIDYNNTFLNNFSSFPKNFSCSSRDRYIVYRVIRI